MANTQTATLPKAYIERLVKITQEAALVAFEPSHESAKALKRLRAELALMSERELPMVEQFMKERQYTERRGTGRLFSV